MPPVDLRAPITCAVPAVALVHAAAAVEAGLFFLKRTRLAGDVNGVCLLQAPCCGALTTCKGHVGTGWEGAHTCVFVCARAHACVCVCVQPIDNAAVSPPYGTSHMPWSTMPPGRPPGPIVPNAPGWEGASCLLLVSGQFLRCEAVLMLTR